MMIIILLDISPYKGGLINIPCANICTILISKNFNLYFGEEFKRFYLKRVMRRLPIISKVQIYTYYINEIFSLKKLYI